MKDELKDIYNATELPEELPGVVEAALRRGERRVRSRRRSLRILSPMAAALAAFVLVLNTVPTFAAAMYEVPVLGEVCRVLTVRSSHYADNTKNVDIEVPAIDVELGEAGWAESVNRLIEATIDYEVAQSEARAEEYYQAYISTGGDPEDYRPIDIGVDYEVYYASDSVLSFAVIKTETLASAYETFHYYNYDLTTGEELQISELAGEGWRERAKAQLVELISSPDADGTYWQLDEAGLEEALDAAQLRLDGAGRPVLVFQKYSLGPGSTGRPELVLD